MSDMNNPPVATLTQPSMVASPSSLPEAVTHNLERYFSNLEGERPSAIYDMVLDAVERPMLELVMKRAAGNQCRASEMLGINRNTLRKKLTKHGLL
jgi:Fis family transcriptional regulator